MFTIIFQCSCSCDGLSPHGILALWVCGVRRGTVPSTEHTKSRSCGPLRPRCLSYQSFLTLGFYTVDFVPIWTRTLMSVIIDEEGIKGKSIEAEQSILLSREGSRKLEDADRSVDVTSEVSFLHLMPLLIWEDRSDVALFAWSWSRVKKKVHFDTNQRFQ